MRSATLAVLMAALATGVAAAAGGAGWSPSAPIPTCGPASDPHVVFPYRTPQSPSGRGAILWLGATPHCGSSPTLDAASLHSNDRIATARALSAPAAAGGPLETAMTTNGQIVAAYGVAGHATLGETFAGHALRSAAPLGGSAELVATANGYIGDADVLSTAGRPGRPMLELREQRHYETSFAAPVTFSSAGSGPITALAVGMDFRADSIAMWAQGGEVYARWVTNTGIVHPLRTLGPAGYAPELVAVLSDNNHAFVMWTDEPPPGTSATATIYLEHSGNHVTFGPPRTLVSFTEPAEQRLTPGSVALARMSPSEGVLAAWTWLSQANFVVSAAGLTSAGAVGIQTLSQPGTDLRLAALAAGPRDDAVAVLESAPRASRGFDETSQAILTTRIPGAAGGASFGPLAQLAPAGLNGSPSVAIDPASDRAVVAWQTRAGGAPALAYAVRSAL
jgi:hypothetical protein